MRIKLTLATVVGLLFCTLATMELPELINLVDDTSNDFSLVVFAENVMTVVKNRMLPQGRPVLADIPRQQAAATFQAHSFASLQTHSLTRTSDDTLHLSCVQRT